MVLTGKLGVQLRHPLGRSEVDLKGDTSSSIKGLFYKVFTKVLVLFFLAFSFSVTEWGIITSFSKGANIAFAQTVDTNDVVNRAITTPKLARRSVGRNKIKSNAITSAKIQDGAIQSQDLDPAIDSAISDSTATNAAQQTTIDANTVATSANTSANATQQTAIDANTTTNTAQQTAIDANTVATSANTAANATQQTAIDANTSTNTAQQTAIDANTSDISTNASNISALDIENDNQQLQVDNLQNDVNQLKLDTADLESENVSQQTAIDANTNTNNTQQTSINANTATNATQQTAINANTATNVTQQTAINANTATNTTQQTAIDANAATNASQQTAISTNTSTITTLQQDTTGINNRLQTLEGQNLDSRVTTLENQNPGGGGADDSDGVEITFMNETEFDPGTGLEPAVDLNGLGLVINQVDPTVTLGTQTLNVLSTGDIPNTSPVLQQIIVDLPAPVAAGHHKIKVSNSQGSSEGFILLSEIAPPFGGNDSFTKLLLHGDGQNGSTAFIDSSSSPKAVNIISGNPFLNTTQKKFGTASIDLTSSGTHLSVFQSRDFSPGDQSTTIDFWFRYTSWAAGNTIMTNSHVAIETFGSSDLRISAPGLETSGANLTPNTWNHIAVVKHNGANTIYTIYVNGVAKGSRTGASNGWGGDDINRFFNIGLSSNGGLSFYIDELRFSKGTARWTSNFTPPPFPYD